MERQSVNSSELRSVGYDVKTRTMEAEFTDGPVYRYFNVPPDAHRQLMAAPSIGAYFNKNIRGVYPYMKVG